MNEKLEKIQKTLEIFKEMHLKNSSEYEKGSQKYRKLTPTGEWNEEHNSSFVEIQRILTEIAKDNDEKSFITYLSDSFIFGPGDIGREDLSWNKYVDIVKKISNYLKYFEDLKKGDTEIKGSYQVVFEQDKLNAFCSSIISEIMIINKDDDDFPINNQNKKSEQLTIKNNGGKIIENLNNKEITIKIEKDKKGYRNIRKGYNFKFVRNGITIIIGENDVGKTNLLDFIYYENDEWDGIDSKIHVKNETGMACYVHLPLFFENKGISCKLHSRVLLRKVNSKEIRFTYNFYYLDLSTVTDFLGRNAEEVKIQKLRKHSCYVQCPEEENYANVTKIEETANGYWLLDYGPNEKFKSVLIEKVVIGESKSTIEEYRGRNKYSKDPYHPIENIGSGYQKLKKLESLVDNIERQNVSSEEEIFAPLLIIDEPEVFLHPSSISDAATAIKNLEKTTTILTTHSPSFLSHFDLTNQNEASLAIIKKDKKENLKDPLYLEEFLKNPEIQGKIEEDYKKFADIKKEKINHENFYRSKWKRLFNQETLRVFFTKKVLFVEGMVDYILFNNILREKLNEELKEVEIIPIFGKFHYVFFYELAKWLNLDFWFLLDEDKGKDESGKEYWKEVYRNREINKIFWEKYGENKVSEEKNEMRHSKKGEGKISWIRFDLEVFLEIKDDSAKDKEYNLLRRETDAIESLEKYNSAKLDELKKIFTDFLKVKEE